MAEKSTRSIFSSEMRMETTTRRASLVSPRQNHHLSAMRMRSEFPITFVGPSNPADGDTVEPPPAIAHY